MRRGTDDVTPSDASGGQVGRVARHSRPTRFALPASITLAASFALATCGPAFSRLEVWNTTHSVILVRGGDGLDVKVPACGYRLIQPFPWARYRLLFATGSFLASRVPDPGGVIVTDHGVRARRQDQEIPPCQGQLQGRQVEPETAD